jgi:uncharacterized membrane protein
MTSRRLWYAGIALLWAALPAIYLQYQRVWDRLPVHMATHFNASGQPNGWSPRESSMWFIMGVTAILVVVATIVTACMRKQHAASWAVLGMFYLILGILYRASAAVIDYNLSGNSLSMGWAMKLFVVAVAAIILLAVIPKRKLVSH